MTPKEKLERAAELIRQAASSLNLGLNNCTCCNRPAYSNWPAKVAFDQLIALPDKLRRIAQTEAFTPPTTQIPLPLALSPLQAQALRDYRAARDETASRRFAEEMENREARYTHGDRA